MKHCRETFYKSLVSKLYHFHMCYSWDSRAHAAECGRSIVPIQHLTFMSMLHFFNYAVDQIKPQLSLTLEVIGYDSSICTGHHKMLSVF